MAWSCHGLRCAVAAQAQAGATSLVQDGTGPDELSLGADEDLYGTTESGGRTGGGVIFKLTLPHS